MNLRDDLVQCVPTKKGHHIMFQGYTYTFKSKLQCGAEQWCCSYRQKTEDKLPIWIPIYFLVLDETKQRCNICEAEINVTEKKLELLTHLKENHKDIIDLHKDNADMGYQIEFLQLSTKDDNMQLEPAGEVSGPPHDYALKSTVLENEEFFVVSNQENTEDKRKHSGYNRKRSWVWKYFEQMTKTIYRCVMCNVVLSIKGSNSNNMNRHIRTRHQSTYSKELICKTNIVETEPDQEVEVDMPKSNKGVRLDSRKIRRSWVWSFFTLASRTRARCKLCKRIISHGGNATGNMNRHLKIVHNKCPEKINWVWKVFDVVEDTYTCKICNFQFMKFNDLKQNITKTILGHLKDEHNVVSGAQIITSDSFYIKDT